MSKSSSSTVNSRQPHRTTARPQPSDASHSHDPSADQEPAPNTSRVHISLQHSGAPVVVVARGGSKPIVTPPAPAPPPPVSPSDFDDSSTLLRPKKSKKTGRGRRATFIPRKSSEILSAYPELQVNLNRIIFEQDYIYYCRGCLSGWLAAMSLVCLNLVFPTNHHLLNA